MKITNLSLLSNTNDIYKFEGEDYKNYNQLENNFLHVSNFGSRERKYIYTNFQPNQGEIQKRKPRILTGWRAKVNGGYDHQLFNKEKLDKLDFKEKEWNDYLAVLEKEKDEENLKSVVEPPEFTQEDEDLRERLLNQGFKDWSKKDFSRLCESLKTIKVNDYEELSKYIKGKKPKEIELYLSHLLPNINKIKGGLKIQARIDQVEAESKKIEGYHIKIKSLFEDYISKSNNLWENISIESKLTKLDDESEFFLNEKKYLLCMLFKFGYGNWSQIKFHIMNDPKVQFSLSLHLKSVDEIKNECIKLLSELRTKSEKENQEKLNKKKIKTQKQNNSKNKKKQSQSKEKKKKNPKETTLLNKKHKLK
jgi:SWI/SNF-related matrix-associated actin-dependent regulator of chromatin subfamily A member 5